MALNKPLMADKVHYSGPSGGGGGGYHHHGGGGGYGYGSGTQQVYSSIGHSGHSGYGGGYGGGGGHSSHSSSKGSSSKKSVALSALTLLAFLFFLHILQTCLQDQSMAETTTTTNIIVMQARTENREKHDAMKSKGDVEALDGEYADSDYAEKKSSTRNWEEMDKKMITTRVKTFSKYDQPEHVRSSP